MASQTRFTDGAGKSSKASIWMDESDGEDKEEPAAMEVQGYVHAL